MLILFSWKLHVNHALIFCLVTYPEMLRVVYLAVRKKQKGARIIGLGFAAFTFSCAYQALMMLEVLSQNWLFLPYVYGIILLVLSMSVYLARSFAWINRDLQKQLDQVKALSDQALEQERRVQKEEIARKQLEAENALKAKELEEAHKRQQVLDELERSNRELRQTQTQLVQSERMASLVNLVAGISHEFNTPAGVISSMQDTLVRAVDKLKKTLGATFPQEYQNNRQLQSTFSLIANANQALGTATERMITIVRNLRNFARLDEAEFQLVDIHEGIDNTLALVQMQLADRITVIKEYGKLPPLPCAPGQLNQVFLHLIKNAVQAIEGKGEIRLSTFLRDGKAHIQISDTGKGIPPEHLERLFDFRFRAGGSRVKMGFGLSISYSFIQEPQRGYPRQKPGGQRYRRKDYLADTDVVCDISKLPAPLVGPIGDLIAVIAVKLEGPIIVPAGTDASMAVAHLVHLQPRPGQKIMPQPLALYLLLDPEPIAKMPILQDGCLGKGFAGYTAALAQLLVALQRPHHQIRPLTRAVGPR